MNDDQDDKNLTVDEQAPVEESSSDVQETPIATDETPAEKTQPEAEENNPEPENEEVEASPAEAADEEAQVEEAAEPAKDDAVVEPGSEEAEQDETVDEIPGDDIIHSDDPNVKWYVVHTYSGHENKVATALKQRVEAEHLEHKIMDVLVPTQEKIEIRGGKKTPVKEKIFPGYILVKMILDDSSWLAVRTTQGVTSFIGIGNKPTPIPEAEVRTIVRFMTQGAAPTFKDVFMVDDTVKIIDGPFSEFIGKVDSVDKEHGKVRVLVSIFGRETPVELDFLQVQKL